ncbi:MAG: hypothetical protein IT419_17640 [Planctomycetes bacterium]|nr:hypothetical protein [Planctomycetota bacterium]
MSFGKLSERQRQVLRHIARYRFTFKEVLSCLFYEGADPQKELDDLRSDGLIVARKYCKGNRSAYQLQPKAADALGMKRRADALGSAALPTHLAIYGFCLLLGRPRIRLEDGELESLFEGRPPGGRYHCLERSSRARRVYHVYVPGDGTKPNDVLAATRNHIAEVIQIPGLLPWLANRVYYHAILVDSNERQEKIKTAIDRATFDDRILLREVAPISVQYVPGFSNLEEALHALA